MGSASCCWQRAVVILISGAWWRDAIDHLLDVGFRMQVRHDVAMVLVEPASSAVATWGGCLACCAPSPTALPRRGSGTAIAATARRSPA
jgi:hypothetical protein